jgi:two-component system response regulator YesN
MLVADDERWIRERIISSIDWSRIGLKIAGEAADGEEALSLYRELRPDIILTDIRMPGISGLDFLKSLTEEGLSAKVIIISGYSDFDYAQKAIKLGVTDYILKPVENTELINVVKKCIRQIEAETYKNRIIEQATPYANLDKKLASYVREGHATGKRNTLEMAVTYIKENYNKPITLNDVSSEVMLNPSYFSKLFKESLGLSFNKYLTQYRINKAKELMVNPTLRIKEIAGMVGYENARYFIQVFKFYTGLSPSVYKEQL